MRQQSVLITLDTTKGEIGLVIGNETLIIAPHFLSGKDKTQLQAVLTTEAQEKIIKKLVANMVLKGN